MFIERIDGVVDDWFDRAGHFFESLFIGGLEVREVFSPRDFAGIDTDMIGQLGATYLPSPFVVDFVF